MTINSIKIVLISFVSSNILSCSGQVKSEHKQAETKTLEIGKTASELDNQIWKIFQDSKGKYWFGSNGNGIYYLDGNQLKLFTTIDGLVNNTIRGIQEDVEGNIYIETPQGISKFDGKQFTTLKAIKSPNNEWKLEQNDLWFGYNARDLYRFDGKFLYELKLPRKDLKKAFGIDTLISPFNSPNYRPYDVFGVNKDKDGNIWFGTFVAGAFRYDGKSFLWFDEKELSILPDGRAGGVRSMIQDKNGYFWLSNFYYKYKINPNLPKGYEKIKAVNLPKDIAKLWQWNSSTNSYTQKVDDKVLGFNAGITDKEGNLWMTRYGGGVWKYDGKTLSSLEIKSDKEYVLLLCICQDNNGTIWLGTENDGVYKQNGDKFEKFKLKK